MIDDRARRGFAAADEYDAYRPSYPPAAIDFMREQARLDETATVVDLGAGTGLMTRLLRPVGRLVAVEPLSEMREVLRARVPEAEIVAGTAESIPLPPATADAMVCAQAFHWFANLRALHEIARVLKPEGTLFLIWNEKHPDDPHTEGIEAALAPYRRDSPGHDSSPWREVFDGDGPPLRLTSCESFTFVENLTLGDLKRRICTYSYIALLDEDARSRVLRQIEGVMGSALDDSPVVVTHSTEVYAARRKEIPATP